MLPNITAATKTRLPHLTPVGDATSLGDFLFKQVAARANSPESLPLSTHAEERCLSERLFPKRPIDRERESCACQSYKYPLFPLPPVWLLHLQRHVLDKTGVIKRYHYISIYSMRTKRETNDMGIDRQRRVEGAGGGGCIVMLIPHVYSATED